MNRFFQRVTVLWAGVFLTLAVSLGALLATVPVSTSRPCAGLIRVSWRTGAITGPFGIFI